jgi:predicted nucleotidyltransferase
VAEPPDLPEPVAAALAAVRARFGAHLVAVLLGGSHAVGQARTGSDVNLLVVAEGLPAHGPARRQLARALGREVLWRAGVRLCVDLAAPDEVGPAEPGAYRVLHGADSPAVAALLPASAFRREGGEGGWLWTWRRPS